jgi:hypothetical protein
MRIRLLPAVFLLGMPHAHAQFHDQGMTQAPVVRTEYVYPDTGTATRPLVIGECLWGNCLPERNVYPQSNYFRYNWPCVICPSPLQPDLYWTLLLNNEPRTNVNNSGPPDASLPRALPGQGLMGFSAHYGDDNFPGDTYWRTHLVLNFVSFANPVFGGLPFLGFAEFSNRGNRGHPLGYLQPSSKAHPSVLFFTAQLWGAGPPKPIPGGTQPATLASYVWMVANWGTKPKAIFITLYHYNLQNSVPPGNPARFQFNWPMTQSAFYPGADIVYIDAEDVDDYCSFGAPSLVNRQDVDYAIDMTALFRCVDERLLFTERMPPTKDIPVTQVLWANESSGVEGYLWMDIHDPRMLPSPGPLGTHEKAISSHHGEPLAYGRETGRIQAELRRQCDAVPGCAERAAVAAAGRQQTMELPIGQQPSRPELLRATQALIGSGPSRRP